VLESYQNYITEDLAKFQQDEIVKEALSKVSSYDMHACELLVFLL
jgi:hypothetical protein